MIKSDLLSETIKNLPNNPGIYKYFNQDDEIIYIGKAKNLKNRVSSYFNKQQYENYKTKKLVENIFRIEFALVDTEMDDLLL